MTNYNMRAVTLAFALATLSLSSNAQITAQQAANEPENIDLNRTFAQEQLAAGNLQDALDGIERVIIASPLDLAARFFRINIMVLLNRGDEVRSELETILTLSLPEADLQRARDLLVRIDKANAKLTAQVRFKSGLEYKDNANNWTAYQATASEGAFVARDDEVNDASEKLDDVGWINSLSVGGTYALSGDKSSSLKFAGSVQNKEYLDTLNGETTSYSATLGLQQRVDATTYELGGTFSDIDKVNYADAARTVTVNTDSEISTVYLNVNHRMKSVTINYRGSQSTIDNSGFDTPGQAERYDLVNTSHAITALAPIRRGLLVQTGLTYAEARNEDQTEGGSAVRNSTDADTTTLSFAAFQTLANGDSLVSRASYGNSKALYRIESSKPRPRRTNTATIGVEYRAELARFVPEMDGWTAGIGAKLIMAHSNLVDYDKDTRLVNAFIERKWDIWK